MKTWLIATWDSFRTGFWFIPTCLIMMAIGMAVILPEVDRQFAEYIPDWIKTAGDTARSTLAALSSALFTVAGVVFSVTVVTLSITSSQLGPRLLRNFLGESITQITIGSCIACSMFCLILLWRIDDAGGNWFVPHLSVAIATLMTLAVLCIVVYLIHRVAHAVQSMHVVADVANELDNAIERMFPERIGCELPTDDPRQSAQAVAASLNGSFKTVAAPADGYLQAIDGESLVKLAADSDLTILLQCKPGDFLIAGGEVARCYPDSRCDDATAKRLGEAFLVGNRRTPRQDVECAIKELVEVAVRALSPGINDPFTATASIDRLSATFCRLLQRDAPNAVRSDDSGNPRVVANPLEFPQILKSGFDQIRRYGASSIVVSLRLLSALTTIAGVADRSADKKAILRQAELIVEGVQLQRHCEGDLEEIGEAFQQVVKACGDLQDGRGVSADHTPAIAQQAG